MEAVENLIEPGLGQSQGESRLFKREAVFTPPDAAVSMRHSDGWIVTGSHKDVRTLSPERPGTWLDIGNGARMFDGTPRIPLIEDVDLTRLRALCDDLLAPEGTSPGDAALPEPAGMARIFDLDADRPAAGVWLDLRAVLTRQTARTVASGPAPD